MERMTSLKTTGSAFTNPNRENIEAYTPTYAVDLIIPFLKPEQTIWAPFSRNEHNFADYLRGKGFRVHNTHFDPVTKKGHDLLTYTPDFHFDIILDNPPFKNKSMFMERAIHFGKPFAFFLPLNAFGDTSFPALFIKHGIEPQMLIPDRRTEFENQKNSGISFKTIYICNNILPKQIILATIDRERRQAA